MENFVLPCTYIHIYYIYILCCMFITRKVHGRFYELDLKSGNGRLGEFARNAIFINDEENGCRLELQKKATEYTRDLRG